MKSLSIILACLTISATFTVMTAYGADTTDCKNIVQGGDNKAVPCDASKGACPAPAAPKPATGTQVSAS